MRAKEPFIIYPRVMKSGKTIYYYQFYYEDGRRSAPRSTGKTTLTAARNVVLKLYREGKLTRTMNVRFREFAEPYWDWDRCPFVTAQRKRGNNLTRSYTDTQRQNLLLHIMPAFGETRLSNITPLQIETWLYSLCDQGYAPVTVNHCLKALRTVLDDAVRRELIRQNPAAQVKPLIQHSTPRDILTPAEVRKMFDHEWPDERHRVFNMLAAVTGMRIGEIQGLKIKHVHPEHVVVCHSWDRKYGLKTTKTGKPRVIPLPQIVSSLLTLHVSRLPTYDPEGFVFHHTDPRIPFDHKGIARELHRAFEAIGINEAERRKRNLTFHAWRHFFNTYFRGKVPDAKLQQLTGHSTLQMTDHYTHFKLEDFVEVRTVQDALFS